MKKIIVALDGLDRDSSLNITNEIKDYIWGVKFNDLLDLEGTRIITEFKKLGVNVFADPKIKDIPNTVSNRVKRYADAGADFITIFVDNCVKSLEAAVNSSGNSKIIGVTILTSMTEAESLAIYHDCIYGAVVRFVGDAFDRGLDGVVCSPRELEIVKRAELARHSEIIKITPGIRPVWSTKDDQERISTPKKAAEKADYLVIGRPITQAENRVEAVQKILNEIEYA